MQEGIARYRQGLGRARQAREVRQGKAKQGTLGATSSSHQSQMLSTRHVIQHQAMYPPIRNLQTHRSDGRDLLELPTGQGLPEPDEPWPLGSSEAGLVHEKLKTGASHSERVG